MVEPQQRETIFLTNKLADHIILIFMVLIIGTDMIVISIIDITARKKVEAERVKLTDELHHTLSEIKQLSGLLPSAQTARISGMTRATGNNWEYIFGSFRM